MSTSLAYLAGIFDGEGTIGFFVGGSKKARQFSLEVKMTDKPIIDLLQSTLGGSVVFRPREKAHWKDQWKWKVRGEEAWAAYYKLQPYLRLKRWPGEPTK